jgi:hypothetical protein
LKEYGRGYYVAFKVVLESGYEPSWMSDYFDTWQYMKEEFGKLGNITFYQEAYEAVHDTAMMIADGIASEMGEKSKPMNIHNFGG